MNKFKYSALLLTLVMPFVPLEASNPVQFPIGAAAWTITVSESNSKSGSSDSTLSTQKGVTITGLEVTQNDKIRLSLITYSNGQSRQNWDIPGTDVLITEDPSGTAYVATASRFISIPYLPDAFNWVQPGLLVEKSPISYSGRSCFHYKGSTSVTDFKGHVIATLPTEAWVDTKTLFPVALDDGQSLAIYTFHAPPNVPLRLPAKFQKCLDYYALTMGMPPSKSISK